MNKIWFYFSVGVFSMLPESAFSIDITENLQMGASVRARLDYDSDRDIKKAGVDTLIPYVRYTSDTWIASARYRFYGKYYPYQYTDRFGDISFVEHAWIGYNLDAVSQIQLGLNKVPFGILPFFSSSISETLGYVVGLEDVYQFGGKYKTQAYDWDVEAGYYLRPAWQGKGTSKAGVTYSNSPAQADSAVENGVNNNERNMFAMRATKPIVIGGWKTEVGGSVLSSTLKNTDTNSNGRRNAAAVHLTGLKGAWSTGLLFARQQMSPKNPGKRDLVTFGGYDSSFNVASRGNLVSMDLNYDLPGSYFDHWINQLRFYGNYSAFLKSGNDFNNSQRYIAGVSFAAGKYVYIAAEWVYGKNDPYVGLNSYTQSLAAGGTNRWANQAKMSIGYTF